MNKKIYLILVACCLFSACDDVPAPYIDTIANEESIAKPVDEKYIWDLTDLYPDLNAWESARLDVAKQIQQLAKLQGSLGNSAQSLMQTSDQISNVYKSAVRVYIYANLSADIDTRNAENEERSQLARNLLTDLSAAVSWYNPELLALGEEKIEKFFKEEPRLAVHAFNIRDSVRSTPYTESRG